MSSTERALRAIQERLVSGAIAPGTRLSSLALARELGMSNMPVRQALTRLQAGGVLELVPNSGHVVRQLDEQELAELHEFRRHIEGAVAAAAAQRITRRGLGELEDICDSIDASAARAAEPAADEAKIAVLRRLLALDQEFHQALARATNNRWLVKAIADASMFTLLFGHKRLVASELGERAQRIAVQHRALLEVVRTRDPVAARRAMEEHIESGRKFFDEPLAPATPPATAKVAGDK